MRGEQRLRPSGTADGNVAPRMRGAEQDRARRDLGSVDGRRNLRLARLVVHRMLSDGGIDPRWLHQRDRDRHVVRGQFDP